MPMPVRLRRFSNHFFYSYVTALYFLLIMKKNAMLSFVFYSLIFLNILNINILMTLSIILFVIAIIGFLVNRKNIIILLIRIELILLRVTIIILCQSYNFNDILGQVYRIYIIAIAGAERAIGLGILVSYYRLRGNISVELDV